MMDRTVRILLETGEINQQHLQFALEEQVRTNESLIKIMVNKGFTTESRIKDALELYELEDLDVKKLQISPDVLKMLPLHIIRNNKVFPLKFEKNKFILAMVDPKDLITKDTVSLFLGKSIALQRFKITEEEFSFLTTKFSHLLGDIKDRDSEAVNIEDQSHFEAKETETSGDPIEKLINRMLESALKKRATQVSIEPSYENVRIRFKIDDTFYEEGRLPRKMYSNFLSHIKGLGGLESEEKSFHYCGHFKFTSSDKKEINIVVNGIKSINGDKLILRPGYPIPDLKKLIYYPEPYEYINNVTSKNKGLILVIGGSGSGKSTTLYSILQHKISNKYQLMTIEDPVKYVFENYISQIQVKNDRISSLTDLVYEVSKHNPDILMVQEIKDEGWSSLIEELALSGMLILTSMKAYNTVSALKRLKRMDFPNFASIQCIINQRLLRKLCSFCKVKKVPSEKELSSINHKIEQLPEVYEADPSGCSKCYGGYRELIGIFEVVKISRELINLLHKNEHLGDDIGKAVNSSCVMNFKEYGTRLLKDGIISFEELDKIL